MVRRGGERRGLAVGAGWAPSYSLGFLPGVVTKGSAGVWHICSCQLLCNYEPRISVHRITSVSFAHTVVGDRGRLILAGPLSPLQVGRTLLSSTGPTRGTSAPESVALTGPAHPSCGRNTRASGAREGPPGRGYSRASACGTKIVFRAGTLARGVGGWMERDTSMHCRQLRFLVKESYNSNSFAN